jgi:hypothetical protein
MVLIKSVQQCFSCMCFAILTLLLLEACDSGGSNVDDTEIDRPRFEGARFDTSSAESFKDSYFEIMKELSPDEVENLRLSFGHLASQESFSRALAQQKAVETVFSQDHSIDNRLKAVGSVIDSRETIWLYEAWKLLESLDGLTELALTYGGDNINGKTVSGFYLHIAQLYIDNNALILQGLQPEYDAIEREFLFLNNGSKEINPAFLDDRPEHERIVVPDASYTWNKSANDGKGGPVFTFQILNGSRIDITRFYGKARVYTQETSDPLIEADFNTSFLKPLKASETRTVEFVPGGLSAWSDEALHQSGLSIKIEVVNAQMPNGKRLREEFMGELQDSPPPIEVTPLQRVTRRLVNLERRIESIKADTLSRLAWREELLSQQIRPEK